jgi:hypothetical protein
MGKEPEKKIQGWPSCCQNKQVCINNNNYERSSIIVVRVNFFASVETLYSKGF